MNAQHFLRSFLASALASTLVLQAAVAHADDTEIFFGGSAIDKGIQPNVLFILDDSGSMTGTDGTTTTRMQKLKTAFNTILTDAGKINVGVMSLNKSPRLLSPVQNIDASLNVKLSTPAILVSGDDASRLDNGTTNISDPTLLMGYVQGPSGNTVTRSLSNSSTSTYPNDNSSYYLKTTNSVVYSCNVNIATARSYCDTGTKSALNASSSATNGKTGLLLFRNLNIPANATNISAKLTVTPSTTNNTKPGMSIALENSKTPGAYNDASSIADRSFAAASSLTATGGKLSGTWTKDTSFVIDISTEVSTLLGATPTANPLADMGLQLRSTTNGTYNYNVGDVTNAPSLTITYTAPATTTRTTGLRFENVAIPKGAIITSARIDFVPASSDDRPVSFDVTAQNTDDAAIFSTSENFTARGKTSNSATWSPTEWRTTSPQIYVEGPTVTGLVQSVIDSNSDWCGNNSMAFFITPTSGSGSRTALSIDTASGLQPTLNVSYTGGDGGCLNPILDISVIDAKDDASQTGTSSTPTLTATTLPFTDGYIATRYQKVPVKQGAIVKSAQIYVTPSTTTVGKATLAFENVNSSAAFAATAKDLSNRTLTSTTANCTITPSTAGTMVEASCGDITALVQSIFARSGWTDGNALSLMFKPTSGTGLALRTYEYNVASSIKLRLKLKSGSLGTNSYTVRDYTKGVVDGLSASGNTPLVPTLSDAANYLVQSASKKPTGAVSSPITSSCQANYLVLLTDGEANGGASTAQKTGINNYLGLSGTGSDTCTTDATDTDEQCGRSLVKWMATNDIADYDGKNTVITHTIGFTTSSNVQATKFLDDLAKAGGGKAYQADSAADLASAFDDIVQSALATNTTFVNSSAPVNSFNRADNLDELYFALFKPSESDRWEGNLKRYRLRTTGSVATIVDADNSPAIDSKTGFFKSNARSYWSGTQDGDDIAKGGAALQLPAPASRTLLTYIGGSMQNLVTTNANITGAMLGDSSMTTVERDNLLKYIRGFDTDNIKVRQAMGDPIHSSPKLVNYGCKVALVDGKCSSPDISAVMGTNEGFIHSFDTSNGSEDYAFMPEALLPNIKQLRNDAKSTTVKPRLYGMDNTVSLWLNDANKDGAISGTGEFAYAYATMGRGGRNIYALDITSRASPKVLWQIIGGSTSGFEKLGQTWSVPAKTRIKVGSTIRDVLIFGGGYDPDQDALNTSTSTYTTDDMGNAVYIVDAKTGAKLWSAGSASGHTTTLSKMKYSIPAPVRTIDLQGSGNQLLADAEKLADQFFVGDMGGQVWRFYINNGGSGSTLVTPGGTGADGVFASIGGATAANARRFYNEPDVALLNVKGTPVLTVNIGSGYRGHPLNEYINDRFYSFRTTSLFKDGTQSTLGESNLYNATTNLSGGSSFEDPNVGWYISLTRSGEKVLSRALTVGGDLYFNTYEPSASTAACSASVGVNRSYGVSLLYSTPSRYTVNADGSITYNNSREDSSNSGGISGDPQVFCTGDECWILPDPAVDPEEAKTPPLGKTYWTDKLDLN